MSDTRECLWCNEDFIQKDTELFCSGSCREKFWKKKDPKKLKNLTLADRVEDVKYEVRDALKQIANIRSNLNRIEGEYSDWEDRIVRIENRIYELETEVSLEEEKDIQKPSSSEIDALALFDNIPEE